VTFTDDLEIEGQGLLHMTLPISTAQACVVVDIGKVTCKIM